MFAGKFSQRIAEVERQKTLPVCNKLFLLHCCVCEYEYTVANNCKVLFVLD